MLGCPTGMSIDSWVLRPIRLSIDSWVLRPIRLSIDSWVLRPIGLSIDSWVLRLGIRARNVLGDVKLTQGVGHKV
jgi:hypothetical protein